MRATIVHESRGRIRLRLKQKTMTFRQADLLETWLKAQPWTKEANLSCIQLDLFIHKKLSVPLPESFFLFCSIFICYPKSDGRQPLLPHLLPELPADPHIYQVLLPEQLRLSGTPRENGCLPLKKQTYL